MTSVAYPQLVSQVDENRFFAVDLTDEDDERPAPIATDEERKYFARVGVEPMLPVSLGIFRDPFPTVVDGGFGDATGGFGNEKTLTAHGVVKLRRAAW